MKRHARPHHGGAGGLQRRALGYAVVIVRSLSPAMLVIEDIDIIVTARATTANRATVAAVQPAE